MEINMKKICKVAGATCAATGVVAVSALVASGAAVGAVAAGFKAAGNTMKDILKEHESDSTEMVEIDSEELTKIEIQ